MRSHRWLRIGHRGASGTAPEHSARAFQLAVEADVDMIELDVQMSRDGELVVMHDLTLERTTARQGWVRDHDMAELAGLDCGSWFGTGFADQRVLSLSQVIELLPSRVRLNVEIKALEEDWGTLCDRLLEVLRTSGRLESTIVSSFLFGALEQLRQRSGDARIGLLTHDPDLSGIWPWADRLGAVSIHPYYAFVDPAAVEAAHQRQLQVIVWTVNDMAAARQLVAMGVDGVISDFPDALKKLAIDSAG